jgi:hypothetical protein
MKQEEQSADLIEVYKCVHCAGVASILIREHTKKGTWPEIEFCPFCGMSNMYSRELDNEQHKLLTERNS